MEPPKEGIFYKKLRSTNYNLKLFSYKNTDNWLVTTKKIVLQLNTIATTIDRHIFYEFYIIIAYLLGESYTF